MSSGYVYDQNFGEERARLAGIESLWDPGSQALLDGLGITEGWRCLEVGAGGGSLVPWMVSRGATVMAIDIDTRFVESLAGEAVEVRRADIRSDELSQSEFDLIHARLVLEHLAERREIIENLVAALRPAGWLVIEDYDWSCFGFEDQDPQFDRVTESGRARVIDSRSPGFDFFRLSFESLRNAIVDTGVLSADDADAAAARFSEDRRLLTPMMMAGIGRR